MNHTAPQSSAFFLTRELRDAAKLVRSTGVREALLASADKITTAAKVLALDLTAENLTVLNGAWANGARLLWSLPPHTRSPDGRSAAMAA